MSIPPISQSPINLALVQKTPPAIIAADPDHDGDKDGAGPDNDSAKRIDIKA